MKREFFRGNRERLYRKMKENSLLLMFSGTEVRKTADEFYPFYTDRNFLYLTGLESKELVFLAKKDGEGQVEEKVFLLPPDPLAERWTGARIRPEQASELSGITDMGYAEEFSEEFHKIAAAGN
ncbi:MAG: aminopeptidase P N-terminal domain-containing protein, partial [Lachnospiraceae bacterium]|nr:aminopeptidase P N-terminal domain-containing protein [Lachnospiraceae bacterium]